MNTSNPFQVPSCFQVDHERRRRERFKQTFIAVVVTGTLLQVGLLIEGCMNQHAKIAEATGTAADLTALASNPPVVAAVKTTVPIPQPALSQSATPVQKVNTLPAGHLPIIYTVKSGDSLTRIARNHGTTVKAIEGANGLASDRIVVGVKLKMPEA